MPFFFLVHRRTYVRRTYVRIVIYAHLFIWIYKHINNHSYEQPFIHTMDAYSYMYIQCTFWPYSYQKRQKFFPYVKHKEEKLAHLCILCYNKAKPKERRSDPCITMHPLHHFTTLKRPPPTMSICAVCACATPTIALLTGRAQGVTVASWAGSCWSCYWLELELLPSR